MAASRKGTSPSEPSAGDNARDHYEDLTGDLLYDPAIGRAAMMGYPCVRLAGRFLASYDDKVPHPDDSEEGSGQEGGRRR